MKSAIFLFAIFSSVVCLAQGKDTAFVVPDGHYVLECWGLSVNSKTDGTIEREQIYQKGTDIVSSSNGITSEALAFQSEDGSQTYSMSRITTTEDLGDGLFKQTVETKNDQKSARFEVQLKAEGFFNLMVSATWDGKAIDVKGREFAWKVMDDGRVFAQDYFLPSPNKLVSANTCIFTPIK